MTINSPTLPAWGTGRLIVTLTGIPKSGTVTATSTSGQVTVLTEPKSVAMGSAIVEFSLQAKKKSSAVNVSGPCGAKSVMVVVQ
jgi:hypothetical protein